MIAKILAYFGYKLVPLDYLKDKLVLDEPELKDHILHFMTRFDELLGATGEWKAHQVYAAMIKKFPEVNHARLRLDMELVYRFYFNRPLKKNA